ncbi:30S ribosomal protein S16 [Frankliniella fusca]|uniref:30S ribosomal protein S16 n=1 Tax=Frankliniella fusca TaxID=407009 RepID=A0AAE1LK90_9NEOP|nr:30S ribosomal protein S16 [Frankliniella fusca]
MPFKAMTRGFVCFWWRKACLSMLGITRLPRYHLELKRQYSSSLHGLAYWNSLEAPELLKVESQSLVTTA